VSTLRRRATGGRKKTKPGAALAKIVKPNLDDEAEQHLALLAAPLRSQLDEINDKLAAIKRAEEQLRKTKTRIEGAVQKLLPDLDAPKKKTKNSRVRSLADALQDPKFLDKLATVEAYLRSRPAAIEPDFTMNQLDDLTSAEDMKIGKDSLKLIIEALRDRGVLRAVRIVRGGGQAYALVSRNGGQPHA
jgi:hypothetical protein